MEQAQGNDVIPDVVWQRDEASPGVEFAILMVPVRVERFRGAHYLMGFSTEAGHIADDSTRIHTVVHSMVNPFAFGFLGKPGPEDTSGAYIGSMLITPAIQSLATGVFGPIPDGAGEAESV